MIWAAGYMFTLAIKSEEPTWLEVFSFIFIWPIVLGEIAREKLK